MGVPFVGFPLYKYVVGGVKGDFRNIFHERYVCGFLRVVLEQEFQAGLVVWRYPREPISNGITFTFVSVMSGMKWEYFSAFLVWAFRILVSSGTVSSKM